MAIIPVGEWLPDHADFNNPGAATITNVLPLTTGSYGPMKAAAVYSAALADRVLGFYGLKASTADVDFAATGASIWKRSTTTWSDVGPGTYSATLTDPWAATAYGDRVIFTHIGNAVQTFLVGVDAAFSDLSATAPRARYCAVVRDFLMLGNVTDQAGVGSYQQRVHWSALGDPTDWQTAGTTAAIQVQSDYQDLAQGDLGRVMGLVGAVGDADGAVLMERGINRIMYVGGQAIFDFTPTQGVGCPAPPSIVAAPMPFGDLMRRMVYYLGIDGFYAFDGAASVPIGAGKVDRTFWNDLDTTYLTSVKGVYDPVSRVMFWAYMGSGSSGLYNRLLAFKPETGRWAKIDISSTTFDWLALSVRNATNALALAAFDSSHRLCYFTGSNLAPTVETTEAELIPGRRARVNNVRPDVDGGGTPSVSIGSRNRLADSVTYASAVAMNALGECPQRVDARYLRARITLPAASTFTHIQGIEIPEAKSGDKLIYSAVRPGGALR